MKKRYLVVALGLLTSLTLAGCDSSKKIDKELSKGLNHSSKKEEESAQSESSTKKITDAEEDRSKISYRDLDSLASPSDLETSLEDKQTKNITFKALVINDPFKMQSEEKDINGKDFVGIAIARNLDEPFFLEVADLKDKPKKGDYIEITGDIKGSIYSTIDNDEEERLYVKAKSFKTFKPKEKISQKKEFRSENGSLYIPEKVRTTSFTDPFGETKDYLIYYFTVDNRKGDQITWVSDAGPLVEIFQGNTQLEEESSAYKDKIINDSSVLYDPSTVDKGKKITGINLFVKQNDDPLNIRIYDDEFNLIYYKELPLTQATQS